MKKGIGLYKKYKEIVNYLIVGALTTVVSLAVYYGCVFTFLDPQEPILLQAANILSWIAAVAFAYFANRIFVFESRNNNRLKEVAAFVSARLATLLMDMAGMFLMVTVCGANDRIAKLIMQVVVTVANYVLSKLVVFRKRN